MELKFKNDVERIAFLEDYRNTDHGWHLWKEDKDIERRMWRLDLPDVSLVVEEARHYINYYARVLEGVAYKWIAKKWYLIESWDGELTFEDQPGSRTMALAELKKAEKKNEA